MNNYVYILVMAGVTVAIRVLPMVLIRNRIRNRFIRSFLFYVPYVTLALMTFPAIIQTTDSFIPGLIALVAGIVCAWFGLGLFPVALTCSALVLIADLLI